MSRLPSFDRGVQCFGRATTVGQVSAANYKIRKTTLRKAMLIIATLIVLNLRPALAGQVLNEAILLVPLLALGTLYVLLGFPIIITRRRVILLVLTCCFLFYLIVQTWVLSPESVILAVQVAIVTISVGIMVTFLFRQRDARLVWKVLTYVTLILSSSQVITYSCILLSHRPDTLFIADLIPPELAQTPWSIRWCFPLTLTAGFESILGMIFPRATGIFREPGLYQMLVNSVFFALDYLDIRHKNFIRLLLAFSLLTTLSTAGYFIFLVCLLYTQTFKIKKKRQFLIAVVTILVGVGISILIWEADVVGLKYKLFGESARLENMRETYELLQQRPILGFGRAEGRRGINFLAVLQKIGLLGGGLYFIIVATSFRWNYSARTLVILMPLLLTLLFAQPIYEKGFVIFLLLLSTRALQSTPVLHS